MIYRGQKYGEPVGEWWTTSLHEAEQFGMSRGGNRTWVVLSVDEDDEAWLRGFYHFERHGRGGTWYRIPVEQLLTRWHGVQVHSGAISPETAVDKARVTCDTPGVS